MYSTKQLLTSVLQFFAMDADAQISYAEGVPSAPGEKNFPFGLDHSPLIEIANGTHNIARVLAGEQNATPEAVEALEDFQAVVELMLTQRLGECLNWTTHSLRNSVEWRLVRKLSRTCLQKLGIPQGRPAIAYAELVPLIMD